MKHPLAQSQPWKNDFIRKLENEQIINKIHLHLGNSPNFVCVCVCDQHTNWFSEWKKDKNP